MTFFYVTYSPVNMVVEKITVGLFVSSSGKIFKVDILIKKKTNNKNKKQKTRRNKLYGRRCFLKKLHCIIKGFLAIRSIFENVTDFHRDILYLHQFLNTKTLLLGEELRFITLNVIHAFFIYLKYDNLNHNALHFMHRTPHNCSNGVET